MNAHRSRQRRALLMGARVMAALMMMLVLSAGIFSLGRLADDGGTAMLFTAGWFVIVFVAGAFLTRKRTGLRLPLTVGFGIVAAAAGIVLGLPMLRDDVVDERVVTAQPRVPASSAASRAAPARNIQIATGTFRPVAHRGRGTAAVIQTRSGEQVLTLTAFETDNGPDLRVYLSTGDPAGGRELGEFEDLGALKGNKGNQQYAIPSGVGVGRFSTVVIWCRAFSVAFVSARLSTM